MIKCVEFSETGPPQQVLKCVSRGVRSPGEGEVLVRLLASPINPSDLLFIQGGYGQEPVLPQVPGFEGVGIVEKCGGGLRGRMFVGKRVVVLNRVGGTWAEYTVVPASQVIPVSSALSLDQAATFFVNPATAWLLTREVLAVPHSEWLIQSAAGSTVGTMIIRLAQHYGFRTLNLVRNERHVARLQKLGADHVFVFREGAHSADDLRHWVADRTGQRGVRYAVDAVGGQTGTAILEALSDRGKLIAYGMLSGEPLAVSARTLMISQLELQGFWLGRYMTEKSLLQKLLLVSRLTRLIKEGVLTTEVAGRFAIHQVKAAVEAATSGHTTGKILLVMNEAAGADTAA